MKQWIGMWLITLSFSVFASDGFNKRFELIKNQNNELTHIKIKRVNQGFSIKPYLEQVKNDLKTLISKDKSSLEIELDELSYWIEENSSDKSDLAQKISAIKDSIRNLQSTDMDAMFKVLKEKGILGKLETELSDLFFNLSPAIIVNTTDARFFYKRNASMEVIKRVLDFARKKLSSVPLLNVATVFIEKVHDLIISQRTFHQNMLMHYLQNNSEESLGMSKSEVDRSLSSIYESRISALNIMESNKAFATWKSYGVNLFFTNLRSANTRLRRSSVIYDSIGSRYNYAFVEVIENGKRVVKNLIDSEHSFTSKSATAFYYDNPQKVKRFRMLLNLSQLGLGFIPFPNWLKSQVNSFISSLYASQSKTEGALLGYFESIGDKEMVHMIFNQSQNPYLVR